MLNDNREVLVLLPSPEPHAALVSLEHAGVLHPARHVLIVLPPAEPRATSPWGSRGFGVMLGVLALAGGWIVGGQLWRANRPVAAPAVVVDTALLHQSASRTLAPSPMAAPLESVASPPPAPGKDSSATRLATLVPDDSLEIIQRQAKNLRERRFRDSVAAAKQLDDRRIRDSLTLVARREDEARQRLEAQARAERLERERREAQTRANQLAAAAAAAAATAERVREAKLTAGKNALSDWMNSLVSKVNAGSVRAPVLAAGPRGFAAFVDKNQPKLSDVRLLTITVNEESAEATAEWVAKWRTAFGTAESRRMKAMATATAEGDTWHLQHWRITEGAP